MLNDLLGYRRSDACKHQKDRLNRIVRLDDRAVALLGCFSSRFEAKITRAKTTIIRRHKGIIALSLDIFKGCEEESIAKRIFHKGKTPAGKCTAEANVFQFPMAIIPHIFIPTL